MIEVTLGLVVSILKGTVLKVATFGPGGPGLISSCAGKTNSSKASQSTEK